MSERAGIVGISAEADDLSLAEHGAKACGLQQLMRFGLRVPPAFVIPVVMAEAVAGGEHRRELGVAVRMITSGDSEQRVAVRSGAAVSLPGAFETMLDVLPEVTAAAVKAVVVSTQGLRVMTIAAALGHESVPPTAVVVQRQVTVDRSDLSGAGAASSRDPVTGEPGPVGSFVWGTRGDAVMSGTVPVLPLAAVADRCPDALADLTETMAMLDTELDGAVEIEFAIEDGVVWYLQVRQFDIEPHPIPSLPLGATVIGGGQPASGGMGVGRIHVDVDDALDAIDAGESVVLILDTTSPADASAMVRAAAVLTRIGGRESHAAVVTRSAGVPAIVSVQGLELADRHILLGDQRLEIGETLIVDGTSGRIARPFGTS